MMKPRNLGLVLTAMEVLQAAQDKAKDMHLNPHHEASRQAGQVIDTLCDVVRAQADEVALLQEELLKAGGLVDSLNSVVAEAKETLAAFKALLPAGSN